MAVMEVRHERNSNLSKAGLTPRPRWWMKYALLENHG